MNLPFLPTRLGLRLKFTLLVTLLLIAVFASQTYVLFTRNLELARNNLSNEVKTYTALSVLPIGNSFSQYYAENHFRFGEIIADILNSSNKTITRIKLYNTEGDLLFDSESLYIDERENVSYPTLEPVESVASPELLENLQKIDPTFLYSKERKEEIESVVLPFLDTYNKHPYSVVYSVSYDRVYQNLYNDIQDRLIIAGLSLGMASILILFFVNIFTLKPIKQVAEGAQWIEGGVLNHVIKVNTKDEIEDLAFSVNKMAQTLLTSQKILLQDKNIISAERNKLSVALSSIADAVIGLDLEHKITVFNKAAETLTGYKADEVLAKNIDEVLAIYDKDKKIPTNTYAPIRNDEFEGIMYATNNLKLVGNAKESYVNIVSGKIKESSHVNLGCLLTLHDVTKETQLEEMKLDFVSMAAHELRTPLTSIKGYLSVYMDEYGTTLNEDQKTYLNRMNISTAQLVSLVENLLSVSRIERGVFKIEPIAYDWLKILKQSVGDFVNRAGEKKITLTFDEPKSPLPAVKVDPLRIGEVINNLLANAISYTSAGGKVRVWIESKPGEVITHVEDTGQGIPEEAIPRLFTKFFRVWGKLEMGSKGTGLGLYISKSIVEAHRGKIWVNSQLGKGSVFSFSLPTETNVNQPTQKPTQV